MFVFQPSFLFQGQAVKLQGCTLFAWVNLPHLQTIWTNYYSMISNPELRAFWGDAPHPNLEFPTDSEGSLQFPQKLIYP